MAKVFLGVGHGGKDPGAVGYIKEADINLKMATACKNYLEANGVEVRMSRYKDENDDLNEEVNECNAYAPDVAVDCHNNGGGGDGFEAYYSISGGVSKILAQNIEAEVKKIGQNSRGCKMRRGAGGKDYYGFIRMTNCPAVICEGVFVDNMADAAQADTDAECKVFGEAYAKGILKTLKDMGKISNVTANKPVEDKPVESKPSQNISGYRVKVTVNALNIRSGAGTNNKVVGCITDGGVYTIVDTKDVNGYKWGKLKSGAGWISLKYTKRV